MADPRAARDRLVLALDVGDLEAGLRCAERLAPWFATAKVGLELYAHAGPYALKALRGKGLRVFADLKLHDIPTTVGRAAAALGGLGVDILNFHAAGGEEMLRAGVEGLRSGARAAGFAQPIALGVTVLTSESDASAFASRAVTASDAGCDGVVCSGFEIAAARALGLRTMVPGIRVAGGATHDQARVFSPADAIAAGADWLVVGRAVTGAAMPEVAAEEVTEMVLAALEQHRSAPS